jgi:drug/metabolite transporter (DMT)-like permease
MVTKYLGEIAAIGTALCWSFGSIFFTVSSRRIGHFTVNKLRLVVGLILLVLAHLLITGKAIPEHITTYYLFWFGLSGIIGFVIGDTLLFKSFVLVGPRLGMLMMSLVPVFATLIAWPFMNEALHSWKILAIVVTLTGVSWAVMARPPQTAQNRNYSLGIICGIGGALGQAIGLVLSKKGLVNGFSPLAGNMIRILIATIIIWTMAALQGNASKTLKALDDRQAATAVCGGALLGPFLGVWLSLIAVQLTYIGIASTLMALPPIFLIPLSHCIFKERITKGTIFGTIAALIGVALIFLL